MTQPPTPAQLTEAMERWLPLFCEYLLELCKAWARALHPALKALAKWCIAYKREALYRRLCYWRFPRWLARLLADRWPGRWLPEL